jgi:hypothetical protein
MRIEEQCHSLRAEIAITVTQSGYRMNLRVGVQIANTLNINHHHLMSTAFEREMTECLQCI